MDEFRAIVEKKYFTSDKLFEEKLKHAKNLFLNSPIDIELSVCLIFGQNFKDECEIEKLSDVLIKLLCRRVNVTPRDATLLTL